MTGRVPAFGGQVPSSGSRENWSGHLTFRHIATGRRYMQVALQLLEAIASGQYPPGARLPADRELAELTGVSRPTVREAILALEFLGIVQVRVGDGTYVTRASERSSAAVALLADTGFPVPTAEVIEARLVIEPAVAAFAAERITPEGITRLEELIGRSARLTDDPLRLIEFVNLGLEFHAELARHCHNASLTAFGAALVDLDEHPLWTLLNVRAVETPTARRTQVAEHRAVLDAVRAGDAATAAALIKEHIEQLGRAIDQIIQRTPNPERS